MSKFAITLRKGFQMTFENGLMASVQWGAGNYCDNYYSRDCRCIADAESATAEVAVIYNGKFINANDFVPEDQRSEDTVIGWLSADQVADFLARVKNAQVTPSMYQ